MRIRVISVAPPNLNEPVLLTKISGMAWGSPNLPNHGTRLRVCAGYTVGPGLLPGASDSVAGRGGSKSLCFYKELQMILMFSQVRTKRGCVVQFPNPSPEGSIFPGRKQYARGLWAPGSG